MEDYEDVKSGPMDDFPDHCRIEVWTYWSFLVKYVVDRFHPFRVKVVCLN